MKSQSQLSNCETATRRKGEWAKAGVLTYSSTDALRPLGIGLAVAFLFLGAACESEYNTVLNPLGPVPGGKSYLYYPHVSTSVSSTCPPGQGSLLVMTPAGMSYAGSMMYFPHLSYFIESANGWPVRCVVNHRTRIDEIPQAVQLPAGRYTLVADADGLGKVHVPVQISNGTLTKVVLQRFRGESPHLPGAANR